MANGKCEALRRGGVDYPFSFASPTHFDFVYFKVLLLIYASSSRSGSMLDVIYKRKQTNQHFEILALRKTVDCKTVLCETRDCEALKCGSWKTRLRDPSNSTKILREVWIFEGPFTCNSTPNFSSFSSFELHVDQVSKTLLDSDLALSILSFLCLVEKIDGPECVGASHSYL